MKDKRTVYCADIHIHTPSSKCYKGAKEDAEYIKILEKAKDKGLKIIAITDHNSVSGYSILISQKEKIEQRIETLKGINDSLQASSLLEEEEKKLDLFKNILLIPGVEFEVNNGIHILVLFNPNTPVSKIEQFLDNGGYSLDFQGFEAPSVLSKWSLFELYDESKKYDCLIIDGHTDSNKGIYNTIPNGNVRAHAFKNSSLAGVCYKSESQRQNLENILKSASEYKRDYPLSFLRSSDAHCCDEIGQAITYFKLEKLDWVSFKEAFSNPIEYIFTNYPEVQNILNDIFNNAQFLTLPTLNEEDIPNFCRLVCSLNNTEGGYILIGINSSKEVVGIKSNDEDKRTELHGTLKIFAKAIRSFSHRVKFDLNAYEIQTNKFIFLVRVFKGQRLIDIKGEGIIYGYEKQAVVKLSAGKVQETIEKSLLSKIECKIEKSLVELEKQTTVIRSNLGSIPILHAYIANSIPIQAVFQEPQIVEPVDLDLPLKENLLKAYDEAPHGITTGNIFYFEEIESPRLPYAYLRYSVPQFNLENMERDSKQEEVIYLTPGGATFYSEVFIPQYNLKGLPILKLLPIVDCKLSAKFLCAFLKSSFFLWYLNANFGELDFFSYSIFDDLAFPRVDQRCAETKVLISRVESEFEKILASENSYLSESCAGRSEIVSDHNKIIDKSAYIIDCCFYQMMKLNGEEIGFIESSLRASQIYLPQVPD